MSKFGGDGYLVFFGTLEIYAREFKPTPGWRLNVTRGFLCQKFVKRQSTRIINCLQYIATKEQLPTNSRTTRQQLVVNSSATPDQLVNNSKKDDFNSGKWDIRLSGEQVSIFIPKFTELMDEWTARKIGSKSGVAPEILKHDKEEEVDTDKEKDIKDKVVKKDKEFILPDWIPIETWQAYMEVRNKKKASKTPYALNLIVKELIKIKSQYNHDPIAVINKSIQSGWTDVYPLKEKDQNLNKAELRSLRNAQALTEYINSGDNHG